MQYLLPSFLATNRGILLTLTAARRLRGQTGTNMSHVLIELDVPEDWKKFRLPAALEHRLHELLDRQDAEGKLTRAERSEAKALTDLVDMLSLMKLRAHSAAKRNGT